MGGPYHKIIEATAYCSCGYCCNWEWGIRLPCLWYIGFCPSWIPLKPRRRKRSLTKYQEPLIAKYWTATSLRGGPYEGFTSKGTYPRQGRPPIFSTLSLSNPAKIPARVLLFPWRFLPTAGTLAADTTYYPFGTRMLIPGYGWGVVEDRGGAIKGPTRIDIYHSSHRDALQWGRRKVKVLIVPPGQSQVDKLRVPTPLRAVVKGASWVFHLLF